MKITVGDHVVTQRFGYTHHGLCVGDDQIIHYSGLGGGASNGDICLSSLNEFTQGNNFWIKEYTIRPYSREDSAKRAFKRLGEDWYNPLVNNCEHFVTWCITGIHSSEQVNNVIKNIHEASTTERPRVNPNSDVMFKSPENTYKPTTVQSNFDIDNLIKKLITPSPLSQADLIIDGFKKFFGWMKR